MTQGTVQEIVDRGAYPPEPTAFTSSAILEPSATVSRQPQRA